MKKFYVLIAACILLCTSTQASHIFATNITCLYTGTANTYHVTYKMYRDCSGIPAPAVVNLCYSSVSAGLNGTTTLNPIAGTGQEVTLGPCYQAGSITSCNGGSGVGMQEYVYEGIVTVPVAATDWIFAYAECCRTPNIMNMVPNGSYLYTMLDNLNAPTNSTPQFLTPAWAQYCVNSPSVHPFTAFDIDGDSLVYSLDNCLDGSSCTTPSFPVTYIAPYTAAIPLSSSVPVSLNTATGEFSFTPNILQYMEVGVNISEYRNGQLISVTHREDLIASIVGVIGTDTITGKVYNDLNANGTLDAGEPGMNGQIIEATPGPYYYSTNSLGDYHALVPLNNYSVTVHSNYPWYYYSPLIHTANFTAFGQVDANNDFGFGAYISVQDLRITLTGPNVRPSLPSTLALTAINMGTITTNATVNLTLDSTTTFLNATPAPASVLGNTVTWNINNMQMLQTENFYINVLIGNVAVGSYINSVAEILPIISDTTPSDNADLLTQFVVNSCDPNEKTVYPDDFITQAQITNGLYLEYTINFQNTGTAPALNINIVDTLDANFVIPSFEVLSASHPYTWNITGQGIITFTFSNINLPDSGSNEPASHGFVKYRLRPSTNFANYYKLINEAYIYFDNNAPITTNYTSTHVYNTTGIIKTENGNNIFIYPNPSKGKISIACSDKSVNEMQVSLYSIIGNKIFEKKIKNTEANETVELTNFAKGIYFVKVVANNKTYQQKIVLE